MDQRQVLEAAKREKYEELHTSFPDDVMCLLNKLTTAQLLGVLEQQVK